MISVIVPVYKVEQYLGRCIDSILRQTYNNFELILIDDGSPDKSGLICDTYMEKDSRVHVIHQKNGGLSAARNTGIEYAMKNSESEWLTFIDSDDWVHPSYLEELYRAVNTFQMKVAICEFKKIFLNESFEKYSCIQAEVWETESYYVKKHLNATVAWGKLYSKSCFDKVRYPIGKIHEDEYTTYKLLFQDIKVVHVNAELYFYFQNPVGIMNSGWTLRRLDYFKALEERLDFFIKNGYTRAVQKDLRMFYWMYHNSFPTKESKDVKKAKKYIKFQARRIIKKCFLNLSVKDNLWIYEIAYPHFTKGYKIVLKSKFF